METIGVGGRIIESKGVAPGFYLLPLHFTIDTEC